MIQKSFSFPAGTIGNTAAKSNRRWNIGFSIWILLRKSWGVGRRPVLFGTKYELDRARWSGKTDERSAVEALRHIAGAAEENLAGIDLVGPDFEVSQFGVAVDGAEGAVDGIEAMGHFDASDAGLIKAGIEDPPLMAEIDFAIGVKIARDAGIHVANIGEVPGDVAGGKIEGAAQGDDAVSKIAAYAIAAVDDAGSGKIRAAGAEAILDILVDPIADRPDAVATVFDLAEVIPCKFEELVGIAIAAGEGVAEKIRRELGNRNGVLAEALVLGSGRDGDKGVVIDCV